MAWRCGSSEGHGIGDLELSHSIGTWSQGKDLELGWTHGTVTWTRTGMWQGDLELGQGHDRGTWT